MSYTLRDVTTTVITLSSNKMHDETFWYRLTQAHLEKMAVKTKRESEREREREREKLDRCRCPLKLRASKKNINYYMIYIYYLEMYVGDCIAK